MNVVVFICHDAGARFGCYGVPGLRTAELDAFAAAGHRFRRYYCCAPHCSPSRAGIWTGRFPHANGVVGLAHGGFRNDLAEGERTLGQILRDAGYATHLFGAQHFSYSDERAGFDHVHAKGGCRRVAAEAAAVLGGLRGPFFAEVAFHEPHRPFPHPGVEPVPCEKASIPAYLPDIPEVREDLSRMEASLCALSQAFGQVLAALESAGRFDDTLIVFTVDHGVPFPHAKCTLYDPGLETALLMHVPGLAGGRVHDALLSNVDLLPTLLDLVGAPKPGNLHGRSFAPLLTGGDYVPRDAVYAEKTYHTYYDPMRAIRTDRWKLIANFESCSYVEIPNDFDNNGKSFPEICQALERLPGDAYHPPVELFDLDADPLEARNLADDPAFREIKQDLVRRLRGWMEETRDPLLEGPMTQAAYRERMAAFKAT